MKATLLLCVLMVPMSFNLRAHPPSATVATSSTQSQAQALAILRRAAAALGGSDAILGMQGIKISLRGKASSRFQAPSASPPFELGSSDFDLSVDFAREQIAFRSFDNEAGGMRHSLGIVGRTPRIYNLHACTVRPFTTPPSFARELTNHAQRTPHLLLRSALQNPLTLRFHGKQGADGRTHSVISFIQNNENISLFIDEATGLITKTETVQDDMLTGTSALATFFDNYQGAGIERAPRALRMRMAEQQTLRGDLLVEVNPAFPKHEFEPEGEFLSVQPSRPHPERVEELARGIYVLHSVSDPEHNALLVEFNDFVVVIDAPHSSEGGQRLIGKIRELAPTKPIRYLALSHHHDDHIAGLRSFVAEGAHVITTPGNRALVEAMMIAPQDDHLSRSPKPMQLETLGTSKRVITDGKRVLELHSIGPVPHAREMLIAYLPDEKILYQSDLFIVPSNEAPVGAPAPSLIALGQAIDRLGLDVDRIAAGHGRTATLADLRERLTYRHARQCGRRADGTHENPTSHHLQRDDRANLPMTYVPMLAPGSN